MRIAKLAAMLAAGGGGTRNPVGPIVNHWAPRRRSYNFRPHNGKRERQRRLRQIVDGRLEVSAETRGEALMLYQKIEKQQAA